MEALRGISMVETRARQFALGGGSTDTCRGGLAALLWEMTSDLRHVTLKARVALLHAGDVACCEVIRVIQRGILALPEGRWGVARTMPCM